MTVSEMVKVCTSLAVKHRRIPHYRHMRRPSFHHPPATYPYSLIFQYRVAPVTGFLSILSPPPFHTINISLTCFDFTFRPKLVLPVRRHTYRGAHRIPGRLGL